MRQVRCIIKCEWANKNLHFNDGRGEENTKTTYIHDHFGERRYKNFIFTIIFFLGGGGGGRKRGEIKFNFSPQKTAVKMTVCLARFRSKGSLIICEIRNLDHVRVYHGISFIQSKTTISIMETCIYSYVYLSISNIYLSVCMYACMYVCMYAYIYMYVCMYVCLSVCLSVCTRISIYRFIFSSPKNGREYKKYFLNFLSTPKVVKKTVFYFLAQKW